MCSDRIGTDVRKSQFFFNFSPFVLGCFGCIFYDLLIVLILFIIVIEQRTLESTPTNTNTPTPSQTLMPQVRCVPAQDRRAIHTHTDTRIKTHTVPYLLFLLYVCPALASVTSFPWPMQILTSPILTHTQTLIKVRSNTPATFVTIS